MAGEKASVSVTIKELDDDTVLEALVLGAGLDVTLTPSPDGGTIVTCKTDATKDALRIVLEEQDLHPL